MTRSLVLGGNRSGKSAFAESLLAQETSVDYLATAQRSDDQEWDERISRHQARRPQSWRTIETAELAGELGKAGPALIDSVTAWLTTTMTDCQCWTEVRSDSAKHELRTRLDGLCAAWSVTTRRVVAVSDEVGSGIIAATLSGRRFADELGLLNQRLAAAADEVYLVTAGIAQRLK